MPILNTCSKHVLCPVVKRWARLGLLLSQLRDTPPFSTSPLELELEHTSTLYCHTRMILLHFQLKVNVRRAKRIPQLRVCLWEPRTVIQTEQGMCGINAHAHCKPPKEAAKATMQNTFQLNYYTNSPKTMSAFLKFLSSSAVGWLLWVCARMPVDLLGSSHSCVLNSPALAL